MVQNKNLKEKIKNNLIVVGNTFLNFQYTKEIMCLYKPYTWKNSLKHTVNSAY